jgi:AsmA protein
LDVSALFVVRAENFNILTVMNALPIFGIMKKLFYGLGVLILVSLLIVLLVPFLVNLNAYQARYLPMIEASLNRKVTLKDLRLTLFPRPGVHITEFTVMDDPLFNQGAFARLASLDLGVKLGPLLRGRVEIGEIIMRDPSIMVIKNSLGLLNVATLGKKDAFQAKKPQEPPVPASGGQLQVLSFLAVDRFSVTNGRLSYRDGASIPASEYSVEKFQVLLQGVGLGLTPVLHVSGVLQPLSLPLKVDGTLGPIRENFNIGVFVFDVVLGKAVVEVKGSAAEGDVRFSASAPQIATTDLPISLPLTKPLQLKNLQLVGEAKDSSINISAITATIPLGKDMIAINGSFIGGEARLKMTAPAITTTELPVSLPLTKPVRITNLVATAEIRAPQAHLRNLSLNVFGGHLMAEAETKTGTVPLPFSGKIAVQRLQLGSLMEAVGTDKVSVTGTGSAEMEMRGKGVTLPESTKTLEGIGHLLIKDGKMEGINLLKEAATLLRAMGITNDLGETTVFSVLESNFKVQEGIVWVDRLIARSPDFDATSTGYIGFDKTLRLNVSLLLSEALSKAIAGSSPIAKALLTHGRLPVPMVITGSAEAPRYALDTKALGSKVQEQVKEKLGELLKGPDGEDVIRRGEEALKKFFGQ